MNVNPRLFPFTENNCCNPICLIANNYFFGIHF